MAELNTNNAIRQTSTGGAERTPDADRGIQNVQKKVRPDRPAGNENFSATNNNDVSDPPNQTTDDRAGGTSPQSTPVSAVPPAKQPSAIRNVHVATRKKPRAQTAARATGTALQVGGAAAQGIGKGADVAGGGLTKAGEALSGTGAGAIVGVPLVAIGGLTRGAGKGLSASGRAVRQTGTLIKRQQRTRHASTSVIARAAHPLQKFLSNVTRFLILFVFTPIQVMAGIFALLATGLWISIDQVAASLSGVGLPQSWTYGVANAILPTDTLTITTFGAALAAGLMGLIGCMLVFTLIDKLPIFRTPLIATLFVFLLALLFTPITCFIPGALIFSAVVHKYYQS